MLLRSALQKIRQAARRRASRRLLSISTAAIGLAVFGGAFAGAQETGKDVPAGHWAYVAVQDLAAKGLIKGYPPDGNFLGGRTLTRYEMAALIQRVVARMDDLVKPDHPATGASAEDRDRLRASQSEIQALIEQFKTELTVIGTDMDTVKSDIVTMKGALNDLTVRAGAIGDQAGALGRRVDATSVLADQALSNVDELKSSVNSALAKKVDVGTGKLRVSGLLQIWYGTGLGDALGGQSPGSPVPQGRNFGGGVGDTFRLRRSQIALDGSITRAVDYHLMFDVAKTGNTTPSGSILQDLWVGYQIVPRLRIEVGQQKTGLSEEGTRADSELLTIARSIMNEDLPVTAGRIGDTRDTGAVLRYQNTPIKGFVGIWNDNGATQNTVDNNRLKFLDGSLYYSGVRHLTLGIWGGTNVGSARPAETRDRAGATFLFQEGPNIVEVEGAYARDYAAGAPAPGLSGTIALGGYLLYAHSFSRKWQVVGRYDVWDPSQSEDRVDTMVTESGIAIPAVNHKLHEYTLGVNYYIHANNAKIQFNYIRDDSEQNAAAFFGKQRTILLSNFQVGF